MKNNASPPHPDLLPQGGEGTNDPHEKPYPGYARELAALQAKAEAAQRSQSTPLPGALRDAFAGEPLRQHGFTFQPVCAWLVAILTRIESPLLEILRIYRDHATELQKAIKDEGKGGAPHHRLQTLEKEIAAQILKEIKPGPDAAIETVFAFVTPVERCQELLDEDHKAFTAAARHTLGRLHPAKLADLERACGRHFSASFATALSVSAVPPESGGDGSVFCPPPPAPRTASAGGSKSSAR